MSMDPDTSNTTTEAGQPGWIDQIDDPTLRTRLAGLMARQDSLSHGDLKTLLNDMIGALGSDGHLSSGQFQDLQDIATNAPMSSYDRNVFGKLVFGDPGNASFTGGGSSMVPLGNLQVGSTGLQLQELTDKWILGTDLPVLDTQDVPTGQSGRYQVSSRSLFADPASGPSVGDINQGHLGDCYLLSSLADIARNDPEAIRSMFHDNGDGTWGVRFYNNGEETWVTVNNEIPVDQNGKPLYNNAFHDTKDMWVNLVEKAYAQLNGAGDFTGNTDKAGKHDISGNSFLVIGGSEGGRPRYALQELINAASVTLYAADSASAAWDKSVFASLGPASKPPASQTMTTDDVFQDIVNALNHHQDVVLTSKTTSFSEDGKRELMPHHAMSVFGYDLTQQTLKIHNPWGERTGTKADFDVKMTDLLADKDVLTVAAPPPTVAPQVAPTDLTYHTTQGLQPVPTAPSAHETTTAAPTLLTPNH